MSEGEPNYCCMGCRRIFRFCCCCLPQRFVVAFMGFLAIANSYTMRNCLSLAITEMVVHHPKNYTVSDDTCPGESHADDNLEELNENRFDWSEVQQGYVLSAFYWFYWASHVPGGYIAERKGAKQVVGLGLLLCGLLTMLTPVCAYNGHWFVVFLRALMGLCEGVMFPAMSALVAQWYPLKERSRAGGIILAGNQIGIVVSSILTGLLLHYTEGQWQLVFYFWGICSVIWYILWFFLVYSTPAMHPFITEEERSYILEFITKEGVSGLKDLPPLPIFRILTSIPLWALILGQVGHDWSLFTIQVDLPKYMKSVLKYSTKENGFLSALPFLSMYIVSVVVGFLSDCLITREYLTIGAQRKIFSSIAAFGPAIGGVAASYAGCNRELVVFLFVIGMATMGFFYSSLKVNSIDLSPNYSGTTMALVNGIGSISGIISPILVGFLIPNNTLGEWRLVFWVIFGVVAVTTTIYVIFGSAQVQPWNNPDKSE